MDVLLQEVDTNISKPLAPTKKRRSRGEDYVNNKDFSEKVAAYIMDIADHVKRELEPPVMPDYVASCIYKIANGLSHSPSFKGYSYREDMVMDAVENCIARVGNYNIEAETRGGSPNAFGYFTQISWYAFLRRIAKEKKQCAIKKRLVDNGNIGYFMDSSEDDGGVGENLVERMRCKNDAFYNSNNELAPIEPFPSVKKRIGRKKNMTKKSSEGPLDSFSE